MERREEMTLADFINASPTNCDYQWYDLLEVSEIIEANAAGAVSEDFDAANAVAAAFIRANKNRKVSVYWPAHATRKGISSDCTCSFAD